MKTVTKKYKVYKFNELSDDVRDCIIDRHYEKEDYPFLEDDIREDISVKSNEIFQDIQVVYSLSYCIGDGLSFSSKVDIEKFIRTKYSKTLKESVIRAILNLVYNTRTEANKGRCYYAHFSHVNLDDNYCGGKDNCLRLWNVVDDIMEKLFDYYAEVCRNAEKYGYSIFEY